MTDAAKSAQEVRVDLKNPENRKGELKYVGGSQADAWNNEIARQVGGSIWDYNPANPTQQVAGALSCVVGIRPNDEIEGMIATQLVASHNAAMECFRRAMIPSQSAEGRQANLAQANKLSRTYVTLVEGLNRHRGKSQQKVTVEHVHVHEGGQAIVGNVEAGGGSLKKIGEQAHAQVAHASQPSLSSPDPIRDGVPVASDAERPMPDARRRVDGSAKGKSERS